MYYIKTAFDKHKWKSFEKYENISDDISNNQSFSIKNIFVLYDHSRKYKE